MPKPPPDGLTPLTPNIVITSPAAGTVFTGGSNPDTITVTGTVFLTCEDPGGQCDIGKISRVDVQFGDAAQQQASLTLDSSPAPGTEQSGSWSFAAPPPPLTTYDMPIKAVLTVLEGKRGHQDTAYAEASITVTIQGGIFPGWSAPADLGGVELTSSPSAVSGGQHKLDVFYRGPNNHLWVSWWDGGPWWSAPADLGGVEITSGPSALAVTTGDSPVVAVFYRGPNNHLWTSWWDGNQWSDPTDLGGVELTSGPTAVIGGWPKLGEHKLDVFYCGPNGDVWTSWWDGGPWWSAPADLGGVAPTSEPSAIRHAWHRLDLFYRGPNNHLWARWWPSDVWYDAQTGQLASPTPAPYDLLAQTFDENGIPLNPVFGSQTWLPGQLADPSLCGSGTPWLPVCTNQVTWIDKSWKCAGSGSLGGHANWGLATYEGRVYWHDHSYYLFDDDYSFALYRDDFAGMTAGDVQNRDYLHCEFNSDQTINYFHTWYWDTLHAAVDSDGGKGGTSHYPWPRTWAVFDGKRAIVMGIFGLDCAHTCGSELHPVYAFAIQLTDSLEHETWSIFVRNWGDEGYCSEGQEEISPGNPFRFTFRFRRPGATAVSIIPAADSDPAGQYGTIFYAANDTPGTGVSGPSLLPNEGALVSFELPPPSNRQRINGMLHLRWQVSGDALGASGRDTGMLSNHLGPEGPGSAGEPEKELGQLVEQMSTAEREALVARFGDLQLPEHVEQDVVRLQTKQLTDRPTIPPGAGPRVLKVVDPGRNEREKRVMERLRAVFGDRIPHPPDGT